MEKDTQKPLSSMIDYYKITMGRVIYEKHPHAEVTFTLKNRASEQPLSQYVAPEALRARLERIREQGFTPEEIAYYAGLTAQNGDAQFTPDYLDYLGQLELPEVNISTDPKTGDLAIDSKGNWIDVTFWETVIMSETNELYYEGLMETHDLTLHDLYDEGYRRLDEKIEKLKQHPGIKFSDFGTRRRFSADWHERVILRLIEKLPEQFVGTSNPWFAYKYDLSPIGTFAHEMPMVYSGIADALGENPLNGHSRMLHDWQDTYGNDLSIALTDTFGSEFFFNDFTPEQAHDWNGLRHDSGDPIEFGERAIEFYEKNEVDPTTKTIVFSDGLDVDTIIKLYEHFKGRVNVLFGWGTSLMNDLGLPANNMVMKATEVRVPVIESDGKETYVTDPEFDGDLVAYIMRKLVKLSDNVGKHTGPQEKVDEYVECVDERNEISRRAVRKTVTMT
jgi:nicotinate phosphoribosyltransferase